MSGRGGEVRRGGSFEACRQWWNDGMEIDETSHTATAIVASVQMKQTVYQRANIL